MSVDIVCDPDRAFGLPILDRTGVRTSDVVGMFLAGEPLDVVADEFGLAVEEVEAVLRYSMWRSIDNADRYEETLAELDHRSND